MSRARLMNALRRTCGYQMPRLGLTAYKAFFKLMPASVETELLPDIHARLDFRDSAQMATYWQGSRFEHPTPAILAAWGQTGADCFFDIGSNYGFFSYWMYSQFPGLNIYSFEPNPKTFAILQGIVQQNRLQRIRPNHLGLADAPGVLRLHPGKEDSGHSTFGEHPELAGPGGVDVAVDTFDSWLKKNGLALPASPKWVVKMDVEGFELKVLHGMRSALQARAFIGLAIEINDFTLKFCGTSREEVFAFLRECGYQPLDKTAEAARWPLSKTANAFFVPISA